MSMIKYTRGLKTKLTVKKKRGQNLMKIKIIRKIDELGRIVIPNDVRRTLKLECGDDVEITVVDNTILLKKSEKEVRNG